MLDTQDDRRALITQLNKMIPGVDFKHLKQLSSNRNIVYLAETDHGHLVFKFSPDDRCASLHREYQAVSELYMQGADVPRPVQLSGEIDLKVRLHGSMHSGRVYAFVAGKTLLPSETVFYELGRSIGQLHNAWKTEEKPAWMPEAKTSEFIHQPLEAISEVFDDRDQLRHTEHLASSVASVLEAYQDRALVGFTHGDAHHFNVIQADDGKMVWIDMEDSSWQWRVYDLATAIWGTFGRGGTAPVWDKLIAGYTSVRPLSDEEATLIRFLIFARHLWWLGLHAANWNRWPQRYTSEQFFESGIGLLKAIGKDVCGLDN